MKILDGIFFQEGIEEISLLLLLITVNRRILFLNRISSNNDDDKKRDEENVEGVRGGAQDRRGEGDVRFVRNSLARRVHVYYCSSNPWPPTSEATRLHAQRGRRREKMK